MKRNPLISLNLKLMVSLVTLFTVFSFVAVQLHSVAQADGLITVNSTSDVVSDDGSCTLREAINAANSDTASGLNAGECAAGSGPDTIDFSVTGTIGVLSTLPSLTSTITIDGPGLDDLTINRGDEVNFGIFVVASDGVATISGLTVADGFSGGGAAIANSGILSLTHSLLTNNEAAAGGALISDGTLFVDHTTFADNVGASGGALYLSGNSTIQNSTFVDNSTVANEGGAIFANAGTTTLTNITVSGNSTPATGGGLVTSAGLPTTVNIFNSTFTGNSGSGGGGIRNFLGTITIKNSIIANNTGGDCSGTITSSGYNLSSDASCSFNNTGDTQNTDPLLGTLADNGGSTETHALLTNSPAIDTGDPAFVAPPDFDQRGIGFDRVANGRIDKGAFEVQPFGPTGNALNFDGGDDKVVLGNLPLSTSQNTIEFWLKPDSPITEDTRILTGQTTSDFHIGIQGGKIVTFPGPNWVTLTSSTIQPDVWTHIAITRNGNSVTAYVNGVQELTGANTATAYNGTELGSWFPGFGAYFDGELDEVRFWNEIRTQAQIEADMSNSLVGNEANLVAYYSFDQGDADNSNAGLTELIDYTGDHDGTLTNFSLTGSASNWVYTGQDGAPTLSTTAASNIAQTTTDSGGNILSIGSDDVTDRGVAYNTTGSPTLADTTISQNGVFGTGTYNSSLSALTADTTYYARAFATNSAGTSYGDTISFTTLNVPTTAPGGISADLELWLKADAEVYNDAGVTEATFGQTVQQWNDQSGAGNDVVQTNATYKPVFQSSSSSFNQNAAIDFSNDFLDRQPNVLTNSTSDGSVFLVAENNSLSAWDTGVGFDNSVTDGDFPLFGTENDRQAIWNPTNTHPTPLQTNQTYIFDWIWETGVSLDLYQNGSGHSAGTLLNSFGTNVIKIGGETSNGEYWDGKIAEVLVYGQKLSDADRQKVESYLAVKYGVTLTNTQNYVDSNGTVIYPSTTTHSGYTTDIAGIGIDDASDLSQLSSQSVNDGTLLSIEGNGANVSDGEFLIWGNNGGTLDGFSQAPSGYAARLNRVWRVAETGDVGSVDLTFDLTGVGDDNFTNAYELALLIDDDGDFSNATIAATAAPGDGLIFFSSQDLANGDYFTLAYEASDTTLQVDTTLDNLSDTCDDLTPNDCSLRGAISKANADISNAYTITIPTGTYTLTLIGAGENNNLTGDLDVNNSIAFVGAGDEQTIINANGIDRVFELQGEIGSVEFYDLSIIGGQATGSGGGIYNTDSVILLSNVSISGTATINGGALQNDFGSVTLAGDTGGVIDGVIGGTNGLTKEGDGTYILTGNNTYSGITYVNEGKLEITHAQSLGPQTPFTTNGTEVADGASLVVSTTGGQFQEPLTLNGAGIDNGGALQFFGSMALSEPVVLATDTTIGQYASPNIPNIAGVISGPSSFTKVGSGTFFMSEAATYTGTTNIDEGSVMVAKAGGVIPNTSAVTVASGAALVLNDNDETIGSLAGEGNVFLGTGTLTVGDDNTNTTFSGVMSQSGGLAKLGSGTFTMSGANTYAGVTTVYDGILLVNGSLAGGVTVDGGTVGGTGTIAGTTIVNGGSTISPGASPEILNTGSIAFGHESALEIEIEGTTPGASGHDQLNVTGTVAFETIDGTGVDLLVSVSEGFTPTIGDTFVIVNNDGSDPVTGNFAGLPEGATVDSDFGGSGQGAVISYVGGDGNDVVITVADPIQTGPVFTVNTTSDDFDGCTETNCSFREAIEAANALSGTDQINFNIPGSGPHVISPTYELPEIYDPVVIDGTTQPGAACSSWPPTLQIEIDGTNADSFGEVEEIPARGLIVSAGNTTIRGLSIHSFSLDGIEINTNGGNILTCNYIGTDTLGTVGLGNTQAGIVVDAGNNTIGGTNPADGNLIVNNGDDGIVVLSGSGTSIRSNSIYNNGLLGIELEGDGVTTVDLNDTDSGANDLQNLPVLYLAEPGSGSTSVQGLMHGAANTTFALDFYINAACDTSSYGEGQTFLETKSVTTDGSGDIIFNETLAAELSEGQFVSATATDPNGNTSEFAQCVRVGPNNTSWPNALELFPDPIDSADQLIEKQNQARWFKFKVRPNSQVVVTLSNLQQNYDLTIYKDIATIDNDVERLEDIARLGAEFAPSAFSPSAFSPSAFSPSAFSPSAFSPSAFSPSAFSPSAFSPSAFSPSAFSPSAFSPSAFSPSAFSPSAFSPSAFSPSAFSPSAFSPSAFSPSAFSSAESRSLIGFSAFEGNASEGIVLNTWNNTGDFYIKVQGRNGVFDLSNPFHVEVEMTSINCDISTSLPNSTHVATDGGFNTVILTDLTRNTTMMEGTPEEKAAMLAALNQLAAQQEVNGVVIDVGADARVAAANTLADANTACPYTKNLVAQSIKDIVDDYRALNPIEYVVVIGDDDVVPFFRYPDTTLLGNEENYVPPVAEFTHSQSSLRLGYVLSQDAYGSSIDISLKAAQFPIPEIPVGRLVETATEITGMIDAYITGTTAGVVPTPSSGLVTGYDFLEDASLEVTNELQSGLDTTANVDTLIAAQELAPALGWTADDLGNLLLNNRYDIAFLAGHFSANSALAADYDTSLITTDLVASPVDMTNAIVSSAGCHSGYNIVNDHGVPGVTLLLDWPQAFAQKKATLIAGTGYQYGDTDFIEYSERIYLEFHRQLRVGNPGEAVSIGDALVRSKQIYLSQTPKIEGLHEKALLEATIFGLPMLSVAMPGDRIDPDSSSSIVNSTSSFGSNPGATLGLDYADITIVSDLTTNTSVLKNVDDNSELTATYLSGTNGIVTNPVEPALPLEVRDVTAPNNKILRGVGFRGGNYTDVPDILPLTGAPATEIRGVHGPFLSDVFFPIRPWSVNYFDALQGGSTNLMVTPAQHRSTTPGATLNTLRKFDDMNFRLYYSDNFQTYDGDSTPALSAPPTIAEINAYPESGTIKFEMRVVGNPAAGIQEVWVTYYDSSKTPSGSWHSLDLTQNTSDSTLWEGTLDLSADGASSEDIRYIVQATNGVGLVALDTNLGEYYRLPAEGDIPVDEPAPTSLIFNPTPASSGAYGDTVTFKAVLTSNDTPLAGKIVNFGLGSQSLFAVTDSNGLATVTMSLIGTPGQYDLTASFGPTAEFEASSVSTPFEITLQGTQIALEVQTDIDGKPVVVATLTDDQGRPLLEQTIFFVITGDNGSQSRTVITNLIGQAKLRDITLPDGTYTVNAYYNGEIPIPGQSTITLVSDSYSPSVASAGLEVDSANFVGTLTINKAISSDSPTAFDFTGDLGEFTLTTEITPSITFADTLADTYTISEDPTSFPDQFWALLAVMCQDITNPDLPQPVSISVDLFNYTADIPLSAGQHVECTFFNDRANFEGGENLQRLYLPLISK